MCRWTKSMLRGRGGCYKHTFYGIESHRCMESTPSLACANKCVFCWRSEFNSVCVCVCVYSINVHATYIYNASSISNVCCSYPIIHMQYSGNNSFKLISIVLVFTPPDTIPTQWAQSGNGRWMTQKQLSKKL